MTVKDVVSRLSAPAKIDYGSLLELMAPAEGA